MTLGSRDVQWRMSWTVNHMYCSMPDDWVGPLCWTGLMTLTSFSKSQNKKGRNSHDVRPSKKCSYIVEMMIKLILHCTISSNTTKVKESLWNDISSKARYYITIITQPSRRVGQFYHYFTLISEQISLCILHWPNLFTDTALDNSLRARGGPHYSCKNNYFDACVNYYISMNTLSFIILIYEPINLTTMSEQYRSTVMNPTTVSEQSRSALPVKVKRLESC